MEAKLFLSPNQFCLIFQNQFETNVLSLVLVPNGKNFGAVRTEGVARPMHACSHQGKKFCSFALPSLKFLWYLFSFNLICEFNLLITYVSFALVQSVSAKAFLISVSAKAFLTSPSHFILISYFHQAWSVIFKQTTYQ